MSSPQTAEGLRAQASATPNAITALELRVQALELDVALLKERQIAPAATKKPAAAKRARKRA